MLGSSRTTALLLSILILAVISSALSLRGQEPRRAQDARDERFIEQEKQKQTRLRSQFPAIDYDAPENPDPKERSKRKEKNKHFDKRNLVSDAPPRVTSMARIIEGYDVPALPIIQSGLIITGEILTSQAYLSNDKSGVYTELTVRVREVLKNTLPSRVNRGDVVTVEREGGIVRYPNGHQRLYQLAGEGMPTVARQYVLFLRAIEQSEDFYVLTGYELSPAGVVPVDERHHFKAYEGYEAQAFLNVIRSSIKQSQQALPTKRGLMKIQPIDDDWNSEDRAAFESGISSVAGSGPR